MESPSKNPQNSENYIRSPKLDTGETGKLGKNKNSGLSRRVSEIQLDREQYNKLRKNSIYKRASVFAKLDQNKGNSPKSQKNSQSASISLNSSDSEDNDPKILNIKLNEKNLGVVSEKMDGFTQKNQNQKRKLLNLRVQL